MIYIHQSINEFVASNIPVTHSLYNPSTQYSIGDEVRLGSYIYKSVTDNNVGNNPKETSGLYWYDGSVPSNEYALVDLDQDTKTVFDGVGQIVFSRGIKDYIAIGNFSASKITVEYIDDIVGTNILHTDEYLFSNNGNVYDLWSYIYGGFTKSTSRTVYTPMQRIGNYVRVTIDNGESDAECGYLVSGNGIDMGSTLDSVSFPDTRIGSNIVSVANFDTILPKNTLMRKMSEAKNVVHNEESVLFVIDESESSQHENMIVIGKITKCDGVGENNELNKLSWEITQATNY